MNDNTRRVSDEDAQKIIDAVVGEPGRTPFGTSNARPGDISIVLRAGGGIEIVSNVIAPAPGEKLDGEGIAIRGTFAMALYKLAHDKGTMAEMLTLVSQEWAENPPNKLRSLDS